MRNRTLAYYAFSPVSFSNLRPAFIATEVGHSLPKAFLMYNKHITQLTIHL